MSDLISRQAAIDIASGYCHPANIAKELAKLPSAQPEKRTEERAKTHACDCINRQRRDGKWELIDDTEFRIPGYRCSICHCECEDWENKPTYNYCPQCGADMREGTDDQRTT